jgi:hypothetical protein
MHIIGLESVKNGDIRIGAHKGTRMTPETLIPIGLTLVGVLVVWIAYVAVVTGGDFGKYYEARGLTMRSLRDPEFAQKIKALDAPPPPVVPPKPSGEPLRLLALLQREGRLLDFLLEDVEGYANEQIGAAVRDIHRSCQKAIREHLVLQPVLQGKEGDATEVPPGFDPSAVRLTGNVIGQPPFRGTLLHHGWRVVEIKLAKPPEGQDEFVVQPAEVELA